MSLSFCQILYIDFRGWGYQTKMLTLNKNIWRGVGLFKYYIITMGVWGWGWLAINMVFRDPLKTIGCQLIAQCHSQHSFVLLIFLIEDQS